MVKYFFQFGFFPWTTKVYCGINAEEPFVLPNIVGIEKKDGYVYFDLLQLLALFFHKYILKVLQTFLHRTENTVHFLKVTLEHRFSSVDRAVQNGK